MSQETATHASDKEILGYSRWWVFVAAALSMGVISPFEYAWSSMSGPIGHIYNWSGTQIGWMFTLFVIFESFGTLPGGWLRDKYGPRWVVLIAGLFSGFGLWATTLGPSYGLVLPLWCLGCFLVGFVYNGAVTTANKWFPDHRALTAGIIAGMFSWGSLAFIFPIRAIPKSSPPSVFFHTLTIIAVIMAAVVFVCALIMKDPPKGWKPAGWTAEKANTGMTKVDFTFGEVLRSWQLWMLILSFLLISSAGLAGVSKIVKYSHSFGFTSAVATAAAGGLAITNGLGRTLLGLASDKFGRENTMIGSYILCGIFLFVTIIAGHAHAEGLFLAATLLAIFFWGSLFALFPATIGDYYGAGAAGANYGILYGIAKGSSGFYGGVLSAILIVGMGYDVAIGVAGVMAIVAGLVLIPLRTRRPVKPGLTAPSGDASAVPAYSSSTN